MKLLFLFFWLNILTTIQVYASQEMPKTEDDLYICGLPEQIKGFEFEFQTHKYSSPNFITLLKGDAVIYKGASPLVWDISHMNMKYLTFKDDLFFLVWNEDCVDLIDEKYFILSGSNEFLNMLHIGAGHNESKFFIFDNMLHFWSRWYCSAHNDIVKNIGSYVKVFNDDTKEFDTKFISKSNDKCLQSGMAEANKLEFIQADIIRE